jgi:hypothetical protein
LGIKSYDIIKMENIPCNKKKKNILSREKKSNFREKSLDCGLVRMESLKPLPVARRFASKRTIYRNKPHAFCRTHFITAHRFVASLLTRYPYKQHGFRLSNLNLMERIPTDIFTSFKTNSCTYFKNTLSHPHLLKH